ncbi:retrovirus-related pol polyprotein from transposon TNT 1-94 [Tanacetum coccineum]
MPDQPPNNHTIPDDMEEMGFEKANGHVAPPNYEGKKVLKDYKERKLTVNGNESIGFDKFLQNGEGPTTVPKREITMVGLEEEAVKHMIQKEKDGHCHFNGKTPYELLRGRKPTLDYFRVFRSKCFILNTKDYLTKFDPKSYEGVFLGYSQNSKAYIILNKHTRKVEESLNVTFDETPPPSKTSPLVDDDLNEEEEIKVTEKKNLKNDIVDETLEIDEIVNIKESRNHPLENVIGNLNQRTLRPPVIYNQQEGIDYDETYAPVARLESIRILLANACALEFKVFQMDVKSAFLDDFINEEEIMPRKSSEDHKNTREYIPMISHESRYIHEGRVVFDNFADLNYIRSLFHFVEFGCLLEINEQICPRFILKFYSQYQVSYSDEGQMFVEFVIQNQFFSFSLKEFAQILDIPCEGACVFTDRWRPDELAYGILLDGQYQTNLPSIEDIISSIRINRDSQVCRILHEEEINVLEYQILTREIEPTLKPLEEIIRENVFCLGVIGNICLHVFVICFIVSENPEMENESYVLYDRVMTPLAAQLEQKLRKDRGTRKGRHSTSSSSAFDQPFSSHLNDDDDDGNDKGTIQQTQDLLP